MIDETRAEQASRRIVNLFALVCHFWSFPLLGLTSLVVQLVKTRALGRRLPLLPSDPRQTEWAGPVRRSRGSLDVPLGEQTRS